MKRRIFTLLILCAFLMPAFFGIIPALAADPGDVVINEIMQNPSAVGDTDGEWFELYNPTGSDIDIEGWTIADHRQRWSARITSWRLSGVRPKR